MNNTRHLHVTQTHANAYTNYAQISRPVVFRFVIPDIELTLEIGQKPMGE
jgi:hypothetical protein